MWTCPKCKRKFKTKNQSHSCVQKKVEDLFINLPPVIKEMYDELARKCSEFCEIKTDTTKSCIYFLNEDYRYIAIKPRPSGLILEFILNHEEDIFPVIKTFAISKYQVIHRIKLDSVEDINDQILGWVQEAHELKKSK